jgi:hypothetical protein
MPFQGISPAAEVTLAPFGLTSVATVVRHTVNDGHWMTGYEQEFALCDVRVEGWDLCATSAAAVLHDSTAGDRFDKVQPFAVIIKDGCDSGLGPAIRREREDRLLGLLEPASIKALEQELWTGDVTEAAEAIAANRNKYLSNGNATSVGAAVAAHVALASLEDALANCGNGERGVIHMTRGTAALLGDRLQQDGDRLVTPAGTLVAAGTGYKSTTATTAAMYATGPLIAHLGAASMLSEKDADYFNPANNSFVLQAERPVAVTWDGCCHFSATVTYA